MYVPAPRVLVVSVATPPAIETLPAGVPSIEKLTDPLGVSGALSNTVAVNVTISPGCEGSGVAVSVSVVAALATAWTTDPVLAP